MTGATWGSTDLGGTVGTLHAGAALRVAHWPADGEGEARGTIVLVQGRAEFIEVYAEAIADLRQRGYAVITFDFRGQGASARKTREGGHVDRYTQYCDDLIAVTRYGAQIGLPRPFHIVAHSAGALAALLAAPVLEKDVERMIVLAPLIQVAKLPMSARHARIVTGLMRLIGLGKKVASKKIKGPSQFAGNPLTSDPERYATLVAISEANPHLMTGAPTIGWVHAALKAMTRLERTMGRPLAIPTLFMASARDSIVSTPAIDRFAKSVPGGGYILVPDAEHQLLIERDELRNLFFAAFETFIMDAPARLAHRKPTRLSRPLRFSPAAEAATQEAAPASVEPAETIVPTPPPAIAPVAAEPLAATTPQPAQPEVAPVPAPPVDSPPPQEAVPTPEPVADAASPQADSEEPEPETASKAVLRRQKRTERLRKRLNRRRSALKEPDAKPQEPPTATTAAPVPEPPATQPEAVFREAVDATATPSSVTPVPPIAPTEEMASEADAPAAPSDKTREPLSDADEDAPATPPDRLEVPDPEPMPEPRPAAAPEPPPLSQAEVKPDAAPEPERPPEPEPAAERQEPAPAAAPKPGRTSEPAPDSEAIPEPKSATAEAAAAKPEPEAADEAALTQASRAIAEPVSTPEPEPARQPDVAPAPKLDPQPSPHPQPVPAATPESPKAPLQAPEPTPAIATKPTDAPPAPTPEAVEPVQAPPPPEKRKEPETASTPLIFNADTDEGSAVDAAGFAAKHASETPAPIRVEPVAAEAHEGQPSDAVRPAHAPMPEPEGKEPRLEESMLAGVFLMGEDVAAPQPVESDPFAPLKASDRRDEIVPPPPTPQAPPAQPSAPAAPLGEGVRQIDRSRGVHTTARPIKRAKPGKNQTKRR